MFEYFKLMYSLLMGNAWVSQERRSKFPDWGLDARWALVERYV